MGAIRYTGKVTGFEVGETQTSGSSPPSNWGPQASYLIYPNLSSLLSVQRVSREGSSEMMCISTHHSAWHRASSGSQSPNAGPQRRVTLKQYLVQSQKQVQLPTHSPLPTRPTHSPDTPTHARASLSPCLFQAIFPQQMRLAVMISNQIYENP